MMINLSEASTMSTKPSLPLIQINAAMMAVATRFDR